MVKTNIGLVQYALSMVGKHYVLGTNCRVLTKDTYNNLLNWCKEWFNQGTRKATVKTWIGQVTTDCHGLIEGYINDTDEDGVVERGEGTLDTTADNAFNIAKVKGHISTIPKFTPGICVRYKDHVGIYIGNGKVVEARGFSYGVCITNLSERPWTHWYEHPMISYNPIDSMPQSNITSKSCKSDVKWLQWRLGITVDGAYGLKTVKAYKQFARQRKWLLVTGTCVGKTGRKALCK